MKNLFFKSNFYVNEEIIKKIKAKKYPKDTIIFPKIGGAILTNKKRILSEESCFDNNVMGLIPNQQILSELLYYFMLNVDLKKFIKSGPVPSLDTKKLSQSSILVPPKEIQKKIIQKLDLILGQLEEKKKEILELQNPQEISILVDSLKKSLLQSLKSGKLSNGKWDKYEKKKIGDITKVTSGGTPTRSVSEYWDGEIPWIKSGELLDGDISDSEEHITELGMKNSSAKLFPPDTVLVALYGQGKTRGKTGRLSREATTNQACCAIFPEPSILYPKYLQYWIRGLYWELRKKSWGGAQPNWNSTTIKNIEIKIPSISEQKKIISQLDLKFDQIQFIENSIEPIKKRRNEYSKNLDYLKSSVLEKAFSGKLLN